ncbi:unnamed protein product [Peniophora sp. CBMAI 1063]|nr:unnamed protein product [Peniophora sp. CBMAI 1063]
MDIEFARQKGFELKPVTRPIPIRNADGSRNCAGSVTHYVELVLTIQGHKEVLPVPLASLGSCPLFIGYDWLEFHNPSVDWRHHTLEFSRCPSSCGTLHEEEDINVWEDEGLEEGDHIFALDIAAYSSVWEEELAFRNAIHIRAFQTKASEIAKQEAKRQKDQTFAERVPSPYHDFKDVFSKEHFDKLPERTPYDHAIEFTRDFKPVMGKVYPLSPAEQKELDAFLKENLLSQRIRPSKSPMASPFFFIKKKDGTLRPVQDYRKLNDMTIKNRYPLPLIQELLDKLKGTRIFTKLDIRWGYNNVRIKEGDKWKAAFRTNRGLFEPLVMFFGLTNSPATFQAMMNTLLKDLIEEGHVIVHLDDILIFTESLDEHRRITRQVLQILCDNHLYLKPEKCSFEQSSIEYLGIIVEEGTFRMDPAKVAAIRDWITPTKKKDVQSFIGLCNFYCRFIQDFSKIARLLHDLTKKDAPWHWGSAQQQAFDALKDKIMVEADASDYAVGAVLSQLQDGTWHPIAFLSKTLNAAERNYEIYDKEMLAIMTALEEWRHYLLGTAEPFDIWTDHQNFTYFREARKLNRRQARWFTELQDYYFVLTHRPGKTMGKPDALSRDAVRNEGLHDNENVVLLKPELFRLLLIQATVVDVQGMDHTFFERIRDSNAAVDDKVSKALAEDKQHLRWSQHEDGVIISGTALYVPCDDTLSADILKAHHDTPMAGHPGKMKMYNLIRSNYFWPGLRYDIKRYTKSCSVCQTVKIDLQPHHAPLHPHDPPTAPWEVIGVNFIGPLPESEG